MFLFKEDLNLLFLLNWCLIMFLNIDYKIVLKVIVKRIECVLLFIIYFD